ncbi:hypothetical protein ACE0DR_03910 [Azotobacter sp. CWF10]
MQLFEQDRNNSQPILGDIVDQFFAPVQFDALTQLASEYQRLKAVSSRSTASSPRRRFPA